MDHRQLATDVLRSVGGKENINKVTHCVTRLRFELKNSKIPNAEEIKAMDGVLTVIQQGGQYQVVIGNQVVPVFNELSSLLGDMSNTESSNEIQGEKKSLFDRFTSMISGVFMPVMGALAASGIIKGLLACLSAFGALTATDGTYIVLNAIGDALFYFFPIFLGSSAAKYFGLNQYVGMIIGSSMVYPALVSFVGSEQQLTFLSLPMNIMNYTSSVFPAIVAVWFASLLNRVIEKRIAQGFRYFLAPFIVLLVTVPLTLFIIGPVITYLSNGLADITTAIYNFNPILAGLVLGGPWILIVMFGLHWAFIPIFINNMATVGYDSVMGLLAANQFAMAGAALAFGLRARDKQLKTLGISTGGTALLGVSEPALYGVLLPQKKPLIMAIIGGSIGGVIGGAFLSKVYAFAPSGVFGIPGAVNPQGIDPGFYGYVLQMAVGLVVGFILTYLWGYQTRTKSGELATQSTTDSVSVSGIEETDEGSSSSVTKAEMTVYSPVTGEVVDLANVADEAFSSEAMGKGIAIIPSNGTIVSPVEGVVTTITKSRHAIAVIANDGVEVLIHVGLDTVKLKGEGFSLKVQEGDLVNVGDVLMEVDLAKIKERGFELITPLIITNSDNYVSVSRMGAQHISAGSPVITIKV
ncbi:PTS system beta-glucoside-specific transporter subunits IIABC [Paenibacillus sp. FSL R5-192]|uniref:beta-glucoside-specific PTS transporter subunit IIABC n=1 Tax=Paenibacillus sp. FSL R5-192 TaxID=1226754 RepID=UPI0003E1F79C|nr:beta-glucoside-specific PTS transporter subunit IIABC [Paenibacillus sp. FSL R5-192]ETT31397.1 PTS system beta-glucoside-specific transporter subunits IIABC [Paenibacillus sp. FSL R5-192]